MICLRAVSYTHLNLIKKAAPDGTTEYTYTAQNKLKTGKTEDGQSSTYTYNALNARIKNVQVRDNKNAGHANSDLKDGSHGTDYLAVSYTHLNSSSRSFCDKIS